MAQVLFLFPSGRMETRAELVRRTPRTPRGPKPRDRRKFLQLNSFGRIFSAHAIRTARRIADARRTSVPRAGSTGSKRRVTPSNPRTVAAHAAQTEATRSREVQLDQQLRAHLFRARASVGHERPRLLRSRSRSAHEGLVKPRAGCRVALTVWIAGSYNPLILNGSENPAQKENGGTSRPLERSPRRAASVRARDTKRLGLAA